MTEREYHSSEILDIACSGSAIALKDGKLVPCDDQIQCSECGFYPKGDGRNCGFETCIWSMREHREEKSNESESEG